MAQNFCVFNLTLCLIGMEQGLSYKIANEMSRGVCHIHYSMSSTAVFLPTTTSLLLKFKSEQKDTTAQQMRRATYMFCYITLLRDKIATSGSTYQMRWA